MDSDTQKLVVRQFVEEDDNQLYERIWYERDKDADSPYERVASVTLPKLSPLEVIIERISKDIPQSVCDAFDRHLWYSQWDFAYLFLVEVPIDNKSFFFLYHSGISDDGWDSWTSLIEIYTEQGEFVDAVDFSLGWTWNNKPFTHEDCKDGKTGGHPPPWPKDNPNIAYSGQPLWTEEFLKQQGAEVEEKGVVTRYRYVWS